MSDFWKDRDSRVGRVDGKTSKPAVDEHCPLLSQALAGRWDEEHACLAGVAYKLSVKFEGGSYLASLWGGENVETWFCTFHGLDALIERVEAALREGKGDWRKPKAWKRP